MMKIVNNILLYLCLAFPLVNQAQIQVGSTQLDSAVLANNLNKPWDLVYTSSDSSLWFTERIGKVSRIDLNTNTVNLVLDLQSTVVQSGEGGLLGMAIIETTAIPKVFLVYDYETPNSTYLERLVRYDYDPNQDSLVNEIVLIDSIPAARNHNGSRLEIINNRLYMSTGDAQISSNAQDLNSLSGKILRIELNGAIPLDNPIPNSPIYSWGHRNPQGLFFANGLLYSSEHGPITDDEINIIEKGRNYGWPNVKGYCNTPSEITFCNDSNVVEPLIAWTPTIAPSGICYYNHAAIPEWKGSILLTTLKNQRLKSLELNASKDSIVNTTDYFVNRWGRLRDVTTNPAGEVFIAINSNPQKIIKLWNSNFTSLKESSKVKKQLMLYPNPSKHYLTVELGLNLSENFELIMYDLNGRKVRHLKSITHKTTIDLKGIKTGLYLVKVQTINGFTKTTKVLVQE